MKKRKNLGKKLVTMLVSVGFFAVLITVLNLMALQAIRGKNNVLIEQFEQYEEAVENNDTAVFETAKGEVAEAIRHINYRDRKSTRLNSSHKVQSRMPSSA